MDSQTPSGNPIKRDAAEPPTCNCIILCDDIVVNQVRGKHTLAGIITAIAVRELPSMIGPYACYIRLSNVYPSARIHIGLFPDGADEPLWNFAVEMPPKTDPLGLYTMPLTVPPFGVVQAGRYLLTVISGGIPLAATPIQIMVPETEQRP